MNFTKRNIFRLIWFSLVGVFFLWQWSTYQSRDLPSNTFVDDDKVAVDETSDRITFLPKTPHYKSEIIFLQGGLVDPKAYGPLCRMIAEDGFTCHLIKMDWRMPQLDYTKIAEMFDLERGDYIIGGHSQGAKIASKFVYENPGLVRGLFLLGTSHPTDFDLSDTSIPTIKLYAEFDGLASVGEVMENKSKLPKDAALVEIKGGNHSQFGYLGTLLTDDDAQISVEEQQRLTREHLARFFMKVEMENRKTGATTD